MDTSHTRFALLATQRSGSTWLVDMLNSHSAVAVYGELFVQGGQGTPRWGAQDLPFWDTYLAKGHAGSGNSDLLHEYLETLYRARAGVRAVGFKLMHGQAGAYPAVVDYIKQNEVSVIHLIRWNFLDIIVSKETAVRRGRFSARVGDEVEDLRIRVNAKELLARLEEQEYEVRKGRKRFANASIPYIEVEYEQLVSGATSFSRLLDFLKVEDTQPLKTSMQKLNTRPHREVIENYARVEQALSGTRFEHLLR